MGFLIEWDESGNILTGYYDQRIATNRELKFGTSTDFLRLYTIGSGGSYIKAHSTADLNIWHEGTDKDIIFKVRNSSSVNEVLRLDGSASSVKIPDSVNLQIGADSDLLIAHAGTNSTITQNTGNLITSAYGGDLIFQTQHTNGTDIIFNTKYSSTTTELMRLDGSTSRTLFSKPVLISTGQPLYFMNTTTGMYLTHDGSNAYIINDTGDLTFSQGADNKSMRFKCDNGSGQTTEYFRVDGDEEKVIFAKSVKLIDALTIGGGNDLQLENTGGANYVSANVGDFYIRNVAQDKDIIFYINDGGSLGEFARIDSSTSRLGIGTTAPDAILDIRGGNEQHLYIQGSNDVGFLARLKTIANGSVLLLETGGTSDSRDILKAVNSSGTVFNLQADGKLCLGAETPSQLLDIHTSSNDEGIRIYCTRTLEQPLNYL